LQVLPSEYHPSTADELRYKFDAALLRACLQAQQQQQQREKARPDISLKSSRVVGDSTATTSAAQGGDDGGSDDGNLNCSIAGFGALSTSPLCVDDATRQWVEAATKHPRTLWHAFAGGALRLFAGLATFEAEV
jgi:hypothetical protein